MKNANDTTRYIVDYCNGIKHDYESLDDAIAGAEEGASYTQANIIINDESGNCIKWLTWYGVKAGDDDGVTIDFGRLGFYGEWKDDND